MGECFSNLILKRSMSPFKFRKMGLHGHVGWAPKAVQTTPLTRKICHEAPDKSIIALCAPQ
jgi:hypothetical protein